MNEPTQTSSKTTETREINTNYSYYDGHYNQPFYVDKTLLIKELLKTGHVLISAPPRFGKTLNMDMARRFLEIEVDEDKRCLKEVQTRSKNFKLFQGKKILRENKKIIKKAFRQHAFLEKSSLWDREEYNKETFMKYFDPVKCASLNKLDVEEGLEILAGFLHGHHGKAVYMFIDDLDVPAGRLEDFNEIKEKYNGYNTTLRDDSQIELYNSWAITNCLKTGNFDVYWPASILDKIKQTIGHAKIRPIIALIMNEMDKHRDDDFFIQFLSELSLFHLAHYNYNLFLEIPNRTVYSVIDEILGSVDSINKYYNHSTELIEKLTDSFEDLARLRNKEAVHALTENIVALFRSRRTLETKYDLQSVLDAYMSQKFQYVVAKCRTSLRAKCDTILVIANLHVMFIIEYKSGQYNSNDTDQPVLDRGYDTLAEEASLKKIFSEDTPTVQNRIYLKIRPGWDGEISITYSFNNMKPNTVIKGGRN
ncbi:hypothetical protein PV325_003517 [Microctonus aethiopoides]|nr:hypothetical protein PV325_003517 [Microctonus aethiopoides]